jgi:hypothetical protein
MGQSSLKSRCIRIALVLLSGIALSAMPALAEVAEQEESSEGQGTWDNAAKDIQTLVARRQFERAVKAASNFIERHPQEARAYEARCWVYFDWLDDRNSISPYDVPLRCQSQSDPTSVMSEAEPPELRERRGAC